MRRANSYRRLTIAQAQQALEMGFELIAADGQVSFRSSDVTRAPLNFSTSTLHRATFEHLRKHKLIHLNESKSQLPPATGFYNREGNYFAVWEKNEPQFISCPKCSSRHLENVSCEK
jgi:hypothetical protein